jgi:riboflavin kinase/FMN adenylyltransferase
VVRRAVEEARGRGARAIAATFEPHPQAVLRPGTEPQLLTVPEVREELLIGCGVDEVYSIPFDEMLAKKSPRDFVFEVLIRDIGAAVVVVGENFRFGYKASGDVGELDRCMREAGGEAVAVPIYAVGEALGESISSTNIRTLLSSGEACEAARLLGRPYCIRGEVVAGDHRGRAIGFPTANVLPDARALVPELGVYAGHVRVPGDGRYDACTNIGVAPTFDRRERRVEAHLLDYEGDLYGKVVDVTFVERLRAEKRFSGIDELRAQIERDIAEARRVL